MLSIMNFPHTQDLKLDPSPLLLLFPFLWVRMADPRSTEMSSVWWGRVDLRGKYKARTHTRFHCFFFSLSLSLSLALSHAQNLSFSLTHSLSHTHSLLHTHTLSFSLSLSLIPTLSLQYSALQW